MWGFLFLALFALTVYLRARARGRPPLAYFGVGILQVYSKLWHGVRVNRVLNIPPRQPAILASNHTASSDGLFIHVGCVRGITYVFAKEFYDDLPLFRWVFDSTACVAVCRGKFDVGALRLMLKRLKEGRILCIYPEGNLSRAGTGKLGLAKGGTAWLALRSRAPVYPVHISGGPQTTRKTPAWFLPSRARVTIGDPLDLSAYYDRPITRALIEEVTAVIMRAIANTNPERR